tara:strand:- start:864 stop:1274 length:411 start_codon:yes stop_codon:yes gene_type:complete
MGMTIKEGMQRIKREFAFGGVEAALNELDDIKYHGFMRAESRWSLEAKAFKFIGNQIAKLAPHIIYTQSINGVVFTNNLSYAIEQGIRESAINNNWGYFTLVVEGEALEWINLNDERDKRTFTPDWDFYPQDLMEA